RGGRVAVKSLGWGPWAGGMVTPALKARFEALGVPLIPLDVGAKMLVDEATDGALGDVEIVLGGAPGSEALLHDEGAPPPQVLELLVSEASDPYLDSHRVKGVPVVPVVLVLEWFARAARALAPHLALAGA